VRNSRAERNVLVKGVVNTSDVRKASIASTLNEMSRPFRQFLPRNHCTAPGSQQAQAKSASFQYDKEPSELTRRIII
jgi:hypothetical protein